MVTTVEPNSRNLSPRSKDASLQLDLLGLGDRPKRASQSLSDPAGAFHEVTDNGIGAYDNRQSHINELPIGE